MTETGGKATWLSLPEPGVKGIGNMQLMDTNSDQIAGMIQKWMADSGLMK